MVYISSSRLIPERDERLVNISVGLTAITGDVFKPFLFNSAVVLSCEGFGFGPSFFREVPGGRKELILSDGVVHIPDG